MKNAVIYTTAKETGQRLSQSTGDWTQGIEVSEGRVAVYVNQERTFQSLLGIGGAITDASAEVFAALTPQNQEELLRAYYDPEDGIGYTLARTTIHSSDFSTASYTYVDDGDKSLSSFSIAPDRRFRLPLIKKAIAAARGNLVIYASPWSAPAYMKSNNSMLNGGQLLADYFDTWARYYTCFIKAYEAEGVPIWGISVQNEPAAKQIWESMNYTAAEERDFLKNHLGPAMEAAGYADKKIIVWDHNRDLAAHWADTIFSDPDAAKYAWGLGFHWYETWAGGEAMQRNLAQIKASYPSKQLVFTEGTNEGFDPDRYHYWPNAERYGEAMIRDFNVGTVGWTDWNILLDERGGPNHVGNFCFAPVHADQKTGELIYTPSYYYIGHLSKFIRPGAVRLATTTNRSFFLATTFQNTDGSIATVSMNLSDSAFDYDVQLPGWRLALQSPARSIQTILY